MEERVPLKKSAKVGVRIIKSNNSPVTKAETVTQINKDENTAAGEWISKPQSFKGLENLVEGSSILPQCIRAYKNNIAGFGIGVRYKEDIKETPEMLEEYNRAEKIIDLLNTDQDTKEVFEDVIEARETYGVAYIEVIRTLAGDVEQIEFIKDTASVEKTKPLSPYISATSYYKGEVVERKKKFCKYKQTVGGCTVYFKEFGDPREMDNRSGNYIEPGETLDAQYHANEIIEFAIGTKPYGRVRWIGQVLGVDGSRSAEQLNNNYFKNGRHTPLMIMIKGGTLSEDSFAKLESYMNDIKGENGQHAFLLLETESTDGRTGFEQQERPEIEVKDLASVLQKDELFQEYLENNRRRVQSSFQLPDLYTGYTTDFNRATAQTAMEVTEKQVFQPERLSLAWVINNKLLNGYNFKYVEVFFRTPDVTNPDDLAKMLGVVNAAGGLTPNKAKDILFKALGETSEDYEGEWGNTPLAYAKTQSTSQESTPSAEVMEQFEKQLRKAASHNDAEIVAVMKEVKKIIENSEMGLTKTPKAAIIEKREWVEEEHPRDDNGRFTSGGYDTSAPARGDFGGANNSDFVNAVQTAKSAQIPENAWRVTAMSVEEFSQEHPNSCCHITPGGSVAAVTADGDIVSVCKMPGDSISGKELVAQAVAAGGIKLDSYDGNHGFYIKCGFEPVSWCKWDEQYAPTGWNEKRDKREDIIFYKYTGRVSDYKTAQDFKNAVKPSADYGEAQNKRDSSI